MCAFVLERARAQRHFLLERGHPMGRLRISTGSKAWGHSLHLFFQSIMPVYDVKKGNMPFMFVLLLLLWICWSPVRFIIKTKGNDCNFHDLVLHWRRSFIRKLMSTGNRKLFVMKTIERIYPIPRWPHQEDILMVVVSPELYDSPEYNFNGFKIKAFTVSYNGRQGVISTL